MADHLEPVSPAEMRATAEPPDTRLVDVRMRRAAFRPTADQAFWTAIRLGTTRLSFANYERFMDIVMCGDPATTDEERDLAKEMLGGPPGARQRKRVMRSTRSLPFPDIDPYRLLKVATEVFLMLHCGVHIDFANAGLAFPELVPEGASEERRVAQRKILEEERARYYSALETGDILDAWQAYLKSVDIGPGPGTLSTIPYLAIIRRKLSDVPIAHHEDPDFPGGRNQLSRNPEWFERCYGILMEKLTMPCFIELIWSYWHEEGMLVQTLNAISQRFQNVRGAPGNPLAQLEIDPLRPLNNFLWGYIQDEQHRLTVRRRVYEYDHHYGLSLYGKAVPVLEPADSRSKFLEGFHNLLQLCTVFFKQDDDTTVVADGFPVLNALKEVHLVLSEGAHNQYGDLPWTARMEMLMQEWLLARPEFREFLPTRIMVAYPEAWMDRVDAMKKLQGWTDVSVLNFRNLGVFGEQILLSIRFGAWSDVIDPAQAVNWARYWRAEIQGYIHAYRAVTGVELSDPQDAGRYAPPSVHLRSRLPGQRAAVAGTPQAGLPPARPGALPAGAPRALPQPSRPSER